MSRITRWGIRCLAGAIAFNSAASAQQPGGTERAPVPRQILTATRVFIGNGGGESYGAESYFHLTKFDGGPDRPYHSFYKAMTRWAHYDLVGSTNEAELLLVIRFTNPVVDRQQPERSSDQPNDWIYDPQLNLSINDPKTGLPLWAITQHIQPANDRARANQYFDEAVTRLVDDLQRLILSPGALSAVPENIALPPGAIEAARRRQREQHAGTGFLLGGVVGAFIASRSVNHSCNEFYDLQGCWSRGQAKARNYAYGAVGGAIIGAALGWLWPVRF